MKNFLINDIKRYAILEEIRKQKNKTSTKRKPKRKIGNLSK